MGTALVQHPLIKAVGFTGSLGGGRELFDLCPGRPVPIPFFGALGSVNPMFLLPAALSERGRDIGAGCAGSMTMDTGQFCTNPGIAGAIDGPDADTFVQSASQALAATDAQTMLTDGIADAHRRGRDRVSSVEGVADLLTTTCDMRNATPYLFETTGQAWLANDALGEEVFGPLGLIVGVTDQAEMVTLARPLKGQQTCTLQMDDDDIALAKLLMPVLERKGGRILAHGFSTGVEVCDSLVLGGPYPASTNFGATSVGTLAIRRFLRPVCYQDIPDAFIR